jgi:hypothetical protein
MQKKRRFFIYRKKVLWRRRRVRSFLEKEVVFTKEAGLRNREKTCTKLDANKKVARYK